MMMIENYEVLITGVIGLITTIISGWMSWFFARKKYNSEVDNQVINNMKESLSFYKALSDDTKARLSEVLEQNREMIEQNDKLMAQNKALDAEVKELKAQIKELSDKIKDITKGTTKKNKDAKA